MVEPTPKHPPRKGLAERRPGRGAPLKTVSLHIAPPGPRQGASGSTRPASSLCRVFLLFALLFLTGFLPADLFAAGPRHTIHTQPDSGVSIECRPFFSNIPSHGYFPVRVSISNHSGRDHQWDLSSHYRNWRHHNTETRSRFRFPVPEGETGVFDILVPVGAAPHQTIHGGNATLLFSGFAIPADQGRVMLSTSFDARGGRGGTTPFLGMTPALHSENWGPLQEARHGDLAGARIDPDRLPGDWRGYSGFDAIWLRDSEWRRIGGIERRALLDWAAAGGELFICGEEQDGEPAPGLAGLPAGDTAGDALAYGFGKVHRFSRDGNRLDRDRVGEIINHELTAGYTRFASQVREHEWDLFEKVGLPAIPVGFFGAFLAGFAILVGPVNLLFFAKPGRRHRLLWTTPLISLGAGLLLILLILLHDGTGATGIRAAVWHHLPEDNKAVVIQDQVSRAGLLIDTRFSLGEASVLTQANIRTGRSSAGTNFSALGDSYGGDWFLSRSTQAQWLQSVPSTRSRIEFHKTTAISGNKDDPVIVSTLEHPLNTVFFRDEAGGIWAGGPLVPGTPLALEPSDKRKFESWWQTERRRFGPATREMIDRQKDRRGYFYASSSGESSPAIDTLESIDWKDQYSIHLGLLSPSP